MTDSKPYLFDTKPGSRHYTKIICHCGAELVNESNIFRIWKGAVWATKANVKLVGKPRINTAKTWEMHHAKKMVPTPPVIMQNVSCKRNSCNKRVGLSWENYWDREQTKVPLKYKIFEDSGYRWEGDQETNTPISPDSLKSKPSAVEHSALQELESQNIVRCSVENEKKLRQSGIFNAENGCLPPVDEKHQLVREFRKKDRDLMKVRKQFIKEYGVKMSENDCTLLHFNIHLVMFEPIESIRTEYKNFLSALKKEFNQDIERYKNASFEFDERAFKELSSTKEFEEFCTTDTKQLFDRLDKRLNARALLDTTREFQNECRMKVLNYLGKEDKSEPTEFLLLHKELYLTYNNNQKYVSVDLKQANFNALRLLDPKLVLDAENWEDLVTKKLKGPSILAKSKMVRARLLGKLEHEKIKCIEAHILDLIILAIYKEYPEIAQTGWRFSCDELMLSCDKPREIQLAIEKHLPMLKDLVRIEDFTLLAMEYNEKMLAQQKKIAKELEEKQEQRIQQQQYEQSQQQKPPKEKKVIEDPTMLLMKEMACKEKKPENIFFIRQKGGERNIDLKHLPRDLKQSALIYCLGNEEDIFTGAQWLATLFPQ